MADLERARALVRDLPKLHFWNNAWQVGGLTAQIGDRLADLVAAQGAPSVIETGAGASSLVFLAAGARAVTSIAPDEALGQRIRDAAAERGIPIVAWHFMPQRSEVALPPMVAAGERFDLAFIDGNHGMPSVFVDFCYLNAMLGRGSVLVVDDLQLHSCAQLAFLLRQQPGFDVVHLDTKQGVFAKLTDDPWLPDWRAQPFVAGSSLIV